MATLRLGWFFFVTPFPQLLPAIERDTFTRQEGWMDGGEGAEQHVSSQTAHFRPVVTALS